MVGLMAQEMDHTPTVVATGGLAPLMRDFCKTIKIIEPDLTLEGLYIIQTHHDNL
jgi:pantothenate kinase type III